MKCIWEIQPLGDTEWMLFEYHTIVQEVINISGEITIYG
jgi:hypothetical protein